MHDTSKYVRQNTRRRATNVRYRFSYLRQARRQIQIQIRNRTRAAMSFHFRSVQSMAGVVPDACRKFQLFPVRYNLCHVTTDRPTETSCTDSHSDSDSKSIQGSHILPFPVGIKYDRGGSRRPPEDPTVYGPVQPLSRDYGSTH